MFSDVARLQACWMPHQSFWVIPFLLFLTEIGIITLKIFLSLMSVKWYLSLHFPTSWIILLYVCWSFEGSLLENSHLYIIPSCKLCFGSIYGQFVRTFCIVYPFTLCQTCCKYLSKLVFFYQYNPYGGHILNFSTKKYIFFSFNYN